MDLWVQEDVNLVAPGFIDFGADHMGSLGFIVVQGGLDWRDGPRGGRPGVEFSWEGFDEGDPATGRGWAVIEENGSLRGHIFDLRSRLEAAGCSAADLATPEVLADKRVLTRARKKVSDDWVEGRAMTPAMVETLRVCLVRRARYGRWGAFPVDPERSYTSFRRHIEVKDHISKYKSFTAVDRVEDRLRSLDKASLTGTQRLALYRAFHTAGLELADRADDSHGNVGQLRRDAWHTYLGIDWQATGLRAEDYWADVCDLVVFEDYALDCQEETLPWRGVPAGHAELIEGLVLDLVAECRSHYLDYQAEEALQQLAWLAVGGRRFNRYVEAAARPGFHQRHLRQRCLALTGVDIDDEGHDPRPTLRVVERSGGHP